MRDLLLALPALLLLGACGSGDGDDTSAPTPTEATESTARESACDLLGDDEVSRLAGSALGEGQETEIAGTLTACVWGSLDATGVQAGVVDASQWAQSLPAAVDQIVSSGVADEENLAKLRNAATLIESGQGVSADRACELFSEIVELNGEPRGADLTLTFFPNDDAPQALTAQVCRNGTYATVLVVRPDLTGAGVEALPARRAVESLLD
jgi:hypothetical protein